MLRCMNTEVHGEEGTLIDVIACRTCRTLWCRSCESDMQVCPECGGNDIEAMTLGDDAYL